MEKQMQRQIAAPVLVLVLAAACYGAPTYSGILTGDGGGITATEDWDSPITSLSWEVTDNMDGSWNYAYVYTVPRKGLSHLILEVSDNFAIEDYLGTGYPELRLYCPDDPGKSNPGLPDDIYGLKFEIPDNGDVLKYSIEFDSTRSPMWGDFYAKSGKTKGNDVYAHNDGFTEDDTDPDIRLKLVVDDHIMVPDTVIIPPPGPVIPSPAAMLLTALGTGVVAVCRQRSLL